jgi:hypothetical protein
MLRTFYDNFDAIECATDPKVFLYPCRGDPRSQGCLQYSSRSRKVSTAVYCENCCSCETKQRRAELSHRNFKLDDTDGKRTAANSATTFKNLSPGEKDARMASLAKDRKKHRRTTLRLLQKGLMSSNSKVKYLDFTSDLRTLITEAFGTLATLATQEKEEGKQHIIEQLVGLSAGEACDEINEKEASDFAAYLMTEIDNKGKEL